MQTIKCEKLGATLAASTSGATLRSWRVNGTEILDGYLNDDEQESLNGFRNAVLAPWSNRIKNGQWNDDGTLRAIPIHAPDLEQGLHGLFYAKDFECEAEDGGLRFQASIPQTDSWPCALTLRVTYTLVSATSLKVAIACSNDGARSVPVGLGWHPYFRLDGPLADARVEINASHWVQTDAAQIPIPGREAFALARTATPLDIPADLDSALTGLQIDEDGWASALLRTGNRSVRIRARLDSTPGWGNFHIYAGLGFARGAGGSVAVEPCQFIPNALNRPDLAKRMMLEPGQVRELAVECEANVA